ncbi:hypothetical protein [Parafrankia sp. FMc2]|uniref:hypothetical protein n=1 Tax=Parafrankia sp. FMc2 TaxID=3233196 RepID=UPI0034D75652
MIPDATGTGTGTETGTGTGTPVTPRQARATLDGLLREKNAEIMHARRMEPVIADLARLRRNARTVADHLALAEIRYVVAARHFQTTPVVLPPFGGAAVGLIYAALFGADLVTLRAVFAQANFEPVDTWTMPVALTIAVVLGVALTVRARLSAVEPENLRAARRRTGRFLTATLLAGLSLLVLGLAVKANLFTVRGLRPASTLQLYSGYALFAGLVIMQATLSAALATYLHTHGATDYTRARAHLLRVERELRRLADRRGGIEAKADAIDARLGTWNLLTRARGSAGLLHGLDRSLAYRLRRGGAEVEPPSAWASRIVGAVATPPPSRPLTLDVVTGFVTERDQIRQRESGATALVEQIVHHTRSDDPRSDSRRLVHAQPETARTGTGPLPAVDTGRVG